MQAPVAQANSEESDINTCLVHSNNDLTHVKSANTSTEKENSSPVPTLAPKSTDINRNEAKPVRNELKISDNRRNLSELSDSVQNVVEARESVKK